MQTLQLFGLERKTAVVTGCDTGLGMSMAIALAEAGADIVGTSRSGDPSNVQKAVEETGRNYTHYSIDIADRKALYAFIGKIIETHKSIDILVNNAGTILRKPAAEHPDEYWDKIIDVNLNAQFILAREFGKHMLEKGSGKIIFTCSLLSFQGGINVPGYTATKSAVAGLVKALGNEWASKGVNVNGIAPGYIATNNTKALREDADRNKAILDRIPAGRWGVPDDFKGPAVFLASPASDYVNGTILLVDGGWMAR
ncbi:MAG: 2-dehydro-3-deoxy-D-gluconate 5-dehydrogenase KduD [Chitinophagaceae bacterium]|nr:2-dehydro-3-deoxy-D-gluconate 5-dehydrogenase KduD [Chitinophagaceae bacterium]